MFFARLIVPGLAEENGIFLVIGYVLDAIHQGCKEALGEVGQNNADDKGLFLFEGDLMTITAVPETKAQRVERLKREKNPWEALDELRSFARKGFDAVPPEWLGTYLRWWGVYSQGDGFGVIGGSLGEGLSVPFLMLRIRLTNGMVTSHQLRTIASVAERYARGLADITVRQNIQLHWIRIEDLPDVLDALWSAGHRDRNLF